MSLYNKIIDQQKLASAWQKVKHNKPTYGSDMVSVEEFDKNLKVELLQLHQELKEHRYEPVPVKMSYIKIGNKMRPIGLFSMRDKVVQTSIAQELDKIYESSFSSRAFSYRATKSALNAVSEIEKAVKKYQFFCKTDIESFFEVIDLELLQKKLQIKIKENDVLELIQMEMRAQRLGQEGELFEKEIGLYQGAGISPILSNIYMMDFDSEMERLDVFYIRYADDILVLAPNQLLLHSALDKMKSMLTGLNLHLKLEKTKHGEISDGFEYLGYKFDHTGKSVPRKAEENLEIRMEDVWLTMSDATIEERLKKGSQILKGWEQYYREERSVRNIYEYVVLVYMMRDYEELSSFRNLRQQFSNNVKGITKYLASIWKEHGWTDLAIWEYEQYFEIAPANGQVKNETYQEEILSLYEQLITIETAERWNELLQAYSDIGDYRIADRLMERIQKLQQDSANGRPDQVIVKCQMEEPVIGFNRQTLELFEEIFVGREDMYASERYQDNCRKCKHVSEPLTRDILRDHFEGKDTIGTYLVRNNETIHYVVFDVDISKRALLKADDSIENYLLQAAQTARNLSNAISSIGLKAYIEFSGYRGYHVWMFFSEWVPIRYGYSILEIIRNMISEKADEITIELFPERKKKKSGPTGQFIKLPYGLHVLSGKRSYFCNDDFSSIEDINTFLSKIEKITCEKIKRVIGAYSSGERNTDLQSNKVENKRTQINLDYGKLGSITENVEIVLRGCTLMQYLVHKSMKTGYLSHFERLSILHVFGHVADEGKEFVHTVMSFTMNYQYHTTQKFIQHLPGKPVSCIKLREQYKQITAEYGCSCIFKRTKDCYPSPVIHAIKNNTKGCQQVTIPISRTLSKNKQDTVYAELNIHTRVQELANKIVELKKQKRGLDKSLSKTEKELNDLFDSAGTDCMEVEMGILVRKRNQNKYEWIIEI